MYRMMWDARRPDNRNLATVPLEKTSLNFDHIHKLAGGKIFRRYTLYIGQHNLVVELKKFPTIGPKYNEH